MSVRELILSIALFLLILSLPVVYFALQQRTDVRPRAEFAPATFSFTPPSLSLAPNDQAPLDLAIDTQAVKLSAIDVTLAFDPQVATIAQIFPNPDNHFTDVLINQIDASSARLVMVNQKFTTDLPTGNIKVATLVVQAVNPGTASLQLTPTEVVAFNGVEADVRLAAGAATTAVTVSADGQTPTATSTPGPSPTPTPTPTFGPSPTPTAGPTPTPDPNAPQISFATAFVGMTRNNPPDLPVRLTVIDELPAAPTQTTFNPQLTPDANAVYRLAASPLPLNAVSAGPNKTLLLKGPKHRQVKVADRIALVAGPNPALDWSIPSLRLEPGDLPNPADNWQQDGVVNAVDAALIIARIGSSFAADLQVADLNYDGTVNALDLSLLVETLSKRYDDEY